MNFTEAVNKKLQIPSHLKVADMGNEDVGRSNNVPLSLYMNIPDHGLLEGFPNFQPFHPRLLADRNNIARPLWNYQLRRNFSQISTPLVPATQMPSTSNLYSSILGNVASTKMPLQFPEASNTEDKACDDSPLRTEDKDLEEPHEENLTSKNIVENNEMEIAAIKAQLRKITGRLQNLEEQRSGWRQKEIILYSALISACVFNTWLWMTR